MIHQVRAGGFPGMTAAELMIENAEMQGYKKLLDGILAKHTGQTPAQIEKDTQLDNWMSSTEAVKYGLVDKVLG
jgi:ATP-dependent Clp protease protease subunit